MPATYPEPQDVAIRVPLKLVKEGYCRGFRHALEGGQINRVEQLKLSFRKGFRAGKLYLKELQRTRGVVNFPLQGKFRFTV
ncbi:MAG: hypothetical protein BMS9Abin26_0030 [Gammaproteobacteria bacterium]|nr:MAG: hypothetical protein BMS9Abin26_0030 [Gammaproteobacteria bacterium]